MTGTMGNVGGARIQSLTQMVSLQSKQENSTVLFTGPERPFNTSQSRLFFPGKFSEYLKSTGNQWRVNDAIRSSVGEL